MRVRLSCVGAARSVLSLNGGGINEVGIGGSIYGPLNICSLCDPSGSLKEPELTVGNNISRSAVNIDRNAGFQLA